MKLIIILSLFLTAANAYAAQTNLVWCNSCSSTQMQTAAKQAGLGITYVGDPINRTVNAYETFINVEDTNPPTRTRETYEIAADSTYVAAIDTGMDFYNAAPVGWKKHVIAYTNRSSANSIFSKNPFATVFDVVNAGRNQNDLVDWLNSGTDFGSDAYLAVGWVSTGFGMFRAVDASATPGVEGTIYFEDGSRVDAYFDKATLKLKLDPSTARDSHNNTVPYLGADGKIHGIGGEVDFHGSGNPADMNNYLNQLASLGVPVYSGGIPPSQHGWACVKSGDGPDAVWTCQYH